jgi:hypothetical protein
MMRVRMPYWVPIYMSQFRDRFNSATSSSVVNHFAPMRSTFCTAPAMRRTASGAKTGHSCRMDRRVLLASAVNT